MNCQSLSAKINQLKVYLEIFQTNGCSVSAICLQETWISQSHDLGVFHIPGYNFLSRNFACTTHGGVAIYLKDCFDYDIMDINDNENIWDGQFIKISFNASINIAHNPKKFILGNIYRPPRENAENYKSFTNDINEILNNHQQNQCEIAIAGDFNIDLLQYGSKSHVNEYFEMILTNSYIPKITQATRITETSKTLIDNIFIKMSTVFSDTTAGILQANISDHLPCFVSLDFINTTRANRKFIYYMSRNYNVLSAFVDEMNNLCTMDKFITDLNCDPNINYDRLDSIIQNSLNEHLPIKLTRFRRKKNG